MAQAGSVYDPDADERTKHVPSDDELRKITGIDASEESLMDNAALRGAEEEGGGFYNPRTDKGEKSTDAAGLADRENSSGSFYNPGDSGQSNFQKFKAKVGGAAKNKAVLFGAAGGGGLIILLIILVVLVGSLKIPNLMQHIVGYEFARLTRQYQERANLVTDEALSVESADPKTLDKLKTRFTEARQSAADVKKNVRDSTWGKMDAYRPQKVIEGLGDSHGLTLKYKGSRFVGLTMDGVDYAVKPVTGAPRFIPGLRQIIEAQNRAQFFNDFQPTLDNALKANNTGSLMRGLVAKQFRRELGIGLVAWRLERFKNKSPDQARLEETKITAEKTQAAASSPETIKTGEIQSTADELEQEAKNALNDNKTLEATVKNGGIIPASEKNLTASFNSTLDKVLNFANPLYGVAVPICIIYDGSLQNSQATIDNQTREQQATFLHYASAADQQKQGDGNTGDGGELAAAVGATNDQLGDISKSNAETLAAGGTVTTSDAPSAEAGAGGGHYYGLADALGLPSFAANTINSLASNACPKLTDLKTAAVVGVANILATIFSGGTVGAAEEGAGQTALQIIKTTVQSYVKGMLTKQVVKKGAKEIERSALNRAGRFMFKQGAIIGATAGLTELARLVTASKAAQVNSGFAEGADAANIAQSGANIHAGELNRRQLFGRPLTTAETGISDAVDQRYVAQANSEKNFTDRYFAVSNADSLVSHLGTGIIAFMGNGPTNGILKIGTGILSPLRYVGSLFRINSVVHAAENPLDQHYGNVQFGWSEDEEKLIQSDPSYQPLENQEILDKSGLEEEIASKYADCFGYSYNKYGDGNWSPTDSSGNLIPNDQATLGYLLSNKDYIHRDKDGNVLSDGICGPSQLGPHNTEPTDTPRVNQAITTYGDLVFRWRLAMSYTTTLDQLTDMQNVTQ